MARVTRGAGLHMAGQVAGAAGLYKTGHFLRGAGHAYRMFSSVYDEGGAAGGAGAESAAGAGSIAELGVAAAGAAAVLGTMMLAVKAAEVGFKTMLYATNELIDSVTTLGGAKGLSAMLIESVTNQKLLNFARLNVAPEERLSRGDMMKLASDAAENASAGAFDRSEWLKAMGQFGILSGSQKNIDADLLKFMGGMAMVAGSTPTGMMEVAARIKAQNPQMSNQQIEAVMLGMHGVGLGGAFSPGELPDASKLWQIAPRLSADPEKGYMLAASLGSLMKKGGATNLNMAAIWVNRLLQAGTIAHFLPGKPGEPITDIEGFLGSVATTETLPEAFGGLKDPVTGAFRSQISKMAGVGEEDFSKEANEKRKEVIKHLTDESYAREQLQKDIEESMTPQEKFRAAFNKITDNLEDQFLPIMKELEPTVDEFANIIVEHKEEISDFLRKLATESLPQFVSAIPSIITMLKALASAMADGVKFILWLTGKPSTVAEAEAIKKEKEQARDIDKSIVENLKKQGVDSTKAEANLKHTQASVDEAVANLNTLLAIQSIQSGKAFEVPPARSDEYDPVTQTGGGTGKRQKDTPISAPPTPETHHHQFQISFATPPPPPPSRSHGAN